VAEAVREIILAAADLDTALARLGYTETRRWGPALAAVAPGGAVGMAAAGIDPLANVKADYQHDFAGALTQDLTTVGAVASRVVTAVSSSGEASSSVSWRRRSRTLSLASAACGPRRLLGCGGDTEAQIRIHGTALAAFISLIQVLKPQVVEHSLH